jgi:type I restriction enzyme R subunit
MSKEANARIKINELLKDAGWRFFDSKDGFANIELENKVNIENVGNDFENTKLGFIDYLLLDNDSKPLAVLEAKRESLEPLFAKEQARNYAISQKVNFIILSNGNVHYLWNLNGGNPERIYSFPRLESLKEKKDFKPNPQKIVTEIIEDDYIALTQEPNYKNLPEYKDKTKWENYKRIKNLRFLRDYQVNALKSIQNAVSECKNRFLFEMATGTGKTLTAAAVIKLFFKTGNAKRVLFLVDRLELETQAEKDLTKYLNGWNTLVYKDNKDDWKKADILVTTIQSLLTNNKYKKYFSPTDFDLIISDEAHRLLGGGNSRALFEYFLGYKLGLTATPKDYLKSIDTENLEDPRELERRQLLDTYATFGCEQGTPTFRYTLVDGAKDNILIMPTLIDARTDVTTKLLSEEGYATKNKIMSDDGNETTEEVSYKIRDFEKKFFSDDTNRKLVQTLIDNGLHDPISNEFGKTLVFAVSQKHAAKITQLLNEYAHIKWHGKYDSDFALQVTSVIPEAQTYTQDFSGDKLLGYSKFNQNDDILSEYKSSKVRVCVTVGMMATGWDCPNILNLAIMRPIFSPSEFIQIKGRGTRINNFSFSYKNEIGEIEQISHHKYTFKFFDFFAVCEYFEEKYDYYQKLSLPKEGFSILSDDGIGTFEVKSKNDGFEYKKVDRIASIKESVINYEGMKVDRMFYTQFEDKVKNDNEIAKAMSDGNIDTAISLTIEKFINKPNEYFNLDKLKKSLKLDRKVTIQELLELIFFGSDIKSKNQLIEDEFDNFLTTIDAQKIKDFASLRYYFYAYLTDNDIREIIDNKRFNELSSNPSLDLQQVKNVPLEIRDYVSTYIKTYVNTDKYIN